MRIEEHFGELIVCGHMFAQNEIAVNSRWQSSSGNVVTVYKADENGVFYSWEEKGSLKYHHKTYFSFQCRYSLIIDREIYSQYAEKI